MDVRRMFALERLAAIGDERNKKLTTGFFNFSLITFSRAANGENRESRVEMMKRYTGHCWTHETNEKWDTSFPLGTMWKQIEKYFAELARLFRGCQSSVNLK
jgi:hypothetical protein